MTIVHPIEDIAAIRLTAGNHSSLEDGACIMELVSHVAGEHWTDSPECVSPVIAAFCRRWWDTLPDDNEARVRLLVPRMETVIGTRTTTADERTRSWMATDWLARVQAPAWLRLAGLVDDADALAACEPIVDGASAKAAQHVLDKARASAAAAWDAAAAGAAARDAWAAAWDAAGSAAWDAAAWDAAAAGAAARDAAWDAAWDAAAAGAAARAKLAPTVAELQDSAGELIDAMCAVGR